MSEQFKKPFIKLTGIQIIGRFGLVLSLFLGMESVLSYGLATWESHGGVAFPLATQLFFISWGIFAIVNLALSILLLNGSFSKQFWYILMALWIFMLAEFVAWELSNIASTVRGILQGFAPIVLLPPIYSAVCIAYFSLKKVREQFSVKL